jgi:hypothetical protein
MENHEVVGEDAQHLLLALVLAPAGGERRAEVTLHPRDHALDLQAATVQPPREAPAHRAPVWRLRPLPGLPRAPRVEPDRGAPEA